MNPPSFLHRITLIWLPILAFALAGAVACGVASSSESEPGESKTREMQIRGMVLEVVARNITEVETLRLLGEDGKEYRFTTEGFVGFSPSHIREHQLFGEPVIVSYVQKGGRLVAVSITD